jgi:hypothetical protein
MLVRSVNRSDSTTSASGGRGLAIEVRVRYVDDWREVRNLANGGTMLEIGPGPQELTDGVTDPGRI